jgi:hypothetical protein
MPDPWPPAPRSSTPRSDRERGPERPLTSARPRPWPPHTPAGAPRAQSRPDPITTSCARYALEGLAPRSARRCRRSVSALRRRSIAQLTRAGAGAGAVVEAFLRPPLALRWFQARRRPAAGG